MIASLNWRCGWPTPRRGRVWLLNIGGGFGIPYFPGDSRWMCGLIAANLERWLPIVAARLPEAEIVLELGRYLVGEAGIYVAEVVDRKVSRGHTFPDRQWRFASPSGGIRQFRPGHPQELSGGGRQPGDLERSGKWSPWWGRFVPRWMCWPTGWNWRKPTSAI
jgi:hypothetical protein